jgi:hypothetical protein
MCIVVASFVVTFIRLDIFMLAPAVPLLFPRVGVPCCVMDGFYLFQNHAVIAH